MNNFDDFTNLYSISKTLRFELKPVGADGKPLSAEDANKWLKNIREEDMKIHKAYLALKLVLDKLHETVITDSLKTLDFKSFKDNNGNLLEQYREEYKKGKDRNLGNLESSLRKKIGETFEKTANEIARNAKDENGNPIFKKGADRGIEYLTDDPILKYIENNIQQYVPKDQEKEFKPHLQTFSRFFTYLSRYNENRENYYKYKNEESTAVATRIVHENLPKFCDNLLQFSKTNEYLNVYEFLKNNNRITQIKDAQTNQMINIYPIDEKMFEIQKFSECLTQEGIDEYNKVIGHYNQLINLYNQAKRNEPNFRRLSPFKTLYKQIGCGKKDSLFLRLEYETKEQQKQANNNSSEVLSVEGILELYIEAGNKFFQEQQDPAFPTIFSLINWLQANENWDGVYWSKSAVDKISNQYFKNWHQIQDRILEVFQGKDKTQKEKLKSVASYNKAQEEKIQINDAVELSGLFEILDQDMTNGWSQNFFKASILEEHNTLIDEKKKPSQNLIQLICKDLENLAKEFCEKSKEIAEIADEYKNGNPDMKGYKNEANILKIKNWLDTGKSILWILKYFKVRESKIKGNSINSELSLILDSILFAKEVDWFGWYDLIRNYLTKKPQDDAKENKLKLNFGTPKLLDGWSDGQEKFKRAVLLKNQEKYYLGILIETNIFVNTNKNPLYKTYDKTSERLILRTLKFQTLAGKGFKRDYGIRYRDISDDQDAIQKLKELIDRQYVRNYPLLKQVTEKEYTDKKSFSEEVSKVLKECYECNFKPIDWNKVLEYVGKRSMYLFEIYSKDFSVNKGEKSKNSNPNLHTTYWQHIFQENSSIQLSGNGEIFFREKAINTKTVHPANQPIYRRSDEKTESIFKHDIIKDKRFTEEKYLFHVPIKINYMSSITGISKGKPNPKAVAKINDLVNEHFTKADDIQFLGIDRGEKHLLSYSLINKEGEILEQGNFDVINKKDYLKEINDAANLRRKKQENWQQKGKIANLKDGYISLVVHEIIQKMKDKDGNYKPTFIVLEDLNAGFKRSRQKFEKQVYQKFELALAKKLNYLVDKKAKNDQIGSITKALQLTPPVSNFQDIEKKKQVGILLYTRANYTSVTDPVTGWRKEIYLKTGSEQAIQKQILEAFTEIGVVKGDYFFKYKSVNSQKEWTLWSGKDGKSLERYRAKRGRDKNQYIVESIDVKKLLDQLFEGFDTSESLKSQLESGKKLIKVVNEQTAWETLRFVIDVIQQIRNSGDDTKNQADNFLLSPVRDANGEHFDSRKYDTVKNFQFPYDADANGAFNIARKGLIMFEHIKHWLNIKNDKSKVPKLNLFISDEEWDLWNTDRKTWKSKLDDHFAFQKI